MTTNAKYTNRRGLEGQELEELRKAMGTHRATTPRRPHINSRGELVLPLRTPTEAREQAAAAAKR